MKQSNQCAVSFLHEQCVGCPYQNQCKPKIFKQVAKIVTSKAAQEYAKIQRNMGSEEFKKLCEAAKWSGNGSVKYPKELLFGKMLRGKQRGKFFFGSQIVALNFRKLSNYRKGRGNYAQNLVLA